ncbi:MAG TPA: serine kinase [Gammaproteobacteria bacterium]|nr:serine kinase [Gammaproteobacteria bacterium]
MTPDNGPKASPRGFFSGVLRQFRAAETSGASSYEYFYDVAGFTIALRFAGAALLPIVTPALSHLRIDAAPAAPDLRVYLWDADSTRVPLPPRPWGENDVLSRGDIRGFDDPVIRTAYTLGPNTLSMLDSETKVALFCTTSAEHIPTDYRGSPLLVILNWWTSTRGLQYVHAGAVGTSAGGVLLVGKGGSGKSTSALSCLKSGLGYAADDYCLLDARGDRPYVHSIYNSAKLEASHIRTFPDLLPLVSNPQDLGICKAVIYLNDHHPERLTRGFPVKAVLIPRVTGKVDTRLTLASQVEGLRALAPSTLFQLSGAGEQNFALMAQFARRIPSYFLEAGTDLKQIPAVIQEFLERA